MRKGQVSTFVFLGLVILLMLGVFYVATVKYLDTKSNPENSIQTAPDLFPIETYVSYCMQKESEPLIKKIALQGGSLNISDNSIADNQKRFILHYTPKNANKLISEQSVAEELSLALKEPLKKCIDLKPYQEMGYIVTAGDLYVNVTIVSDQVITYLYFPIKLEKDAEIINKNEFRESTLLPLGKMLSLAKDITNSELQKNNYDLDSFRLQNPTLAITKRKPYPYVIYSIDSKSDNLASPNNETILQFNFGIEKHDSSLNKFTSSSSLFAIPLSDNQGSCIVENSCYSHVTEKSCLNQNGEFSLGKDDCLLENKEYVDLDLATQINSDDLKNNIPKSNKCTQWYNPYSGNIETINKYSGESWCSFEQGVGGRFYKISCVDGNAIVEQCADYKDEICTQRTVVITPAAHSINATIAECRPNRFLDCKECTTKDCCDNSQVRDCFWSTQNICVPLAEPGLKFWNYNDASQICAVGSTRLNSSNTNIASLNCFSSGDCGNKDNFFGDYFEDKTANSNLIKKDLYNSITSQQRTSLLDFSSISLDYNYLFSSDSARLNNLNSNISNTNLKSNNNLDFIEVLGKYLQKIEQLLFYNVDDYLNPDFQISSSDNAIVDCKPWSPKATSSCNLCNKKITQLGTEDYSECTEYKCRSLGSDCLFEVKDGIPNCYVNEISTSKPSIINFTSNYPITKETTDLGEGFVIDNKVKLFSQVNVKFNTDKETLCKASYLPEKNYFDINSQDLSAHEYTSNQSFVFGLNSDLSILLTAKSYFNANNYNDLMSKLIELRFKIESLKKKYPQNDKYSEELYPLITPLTDYYLDITVQSKLQKILTDLDNGTYYVFYKCIDKSGSPSNDYYLKFNLDSPCEDKTSPVILGSDYDGNTLTIYTDEISACKYDFENKDFNSMSNTFDCETNPYRLNSLYSGSYLCTAKANILQNSNTNNTEIYVKCKDHPELDEINTAINLNFTLDNQVDYSIGTEVLPQVTLISENAEITNTSVLYTINNTNSSQDIIVNYPEVKKYIEVNFNKPLVCQDLNSTFAIQNNIKCGNSKCVVSSSEFSGEMNCKRKTYQCDSLIQNANENSAIINITKPISLTIEKISFQNDTILVTLSNLSNMSTSKIECGVKISEDKGYFLMNQILKENQTYFSYSPKDIAQIKQIDVYCASDTGLYDKKSLEKEQ